MTSKENLQRQLAIISDELSNLEYFCDTEIVGDDARHLLDDIKAASREHLRAKNTPLTDLSELKPLYDRLKRVYTSIRVMRNTLAQCEKAIDKAIESCHSVAQHIEESNKPDDESI
jgi:hypothetical protein